MFRMTQSVGRFTQHSVVSFSALFFVVVSTGSVRGEEGPKGTTPEPNKVPLTARVEAVSNAATSQDIPKPPINETHQLYLPLQEAYKAREALKAVKDYEALFTKQELLGRKLLKSTMLLKVRHEPFSVYLKFLDTNAGREVIYVQGRNNNNLLVHEAGFKAIVGTLQLPPTGPDAMADNKYPVSMIGLQIMLDRVISQWEAEGKFGEVKTQKYPDATLPTGETCIAYESLHPVPRDEFKFHITRLWIDKQTNLPIRVEQIGFPKGKDKTPPLVEEYTYSKMKINVKLTDKDFDPKNPAYAFP